MLILGFNFFKIKSIGINGLSLDCSPTAQITKKSWNPDALTTGNNTYRFGTVDEVQAEQTPYKDDMLPAVWYY